MGKENNSMHVLSDISHEKMWTWLRKGNFKSETESRLIAAQNSAIRTNHVKAEWIRRNKTADIVYGVTEAKQSIT